MATPDKPQPWNAVSSSPSSPSLAASAAPLTTTPPPRSSTDLARARTADSSPVAAAATAVAAVTSSSSSPGGALTPRRSILRLSRQSTQERLDAILETARQRAENLSAPQPPLALQPQRTVSFVRMEPLLRSPSAPGALPPGSENDNETTGIIRAEHVGGGGGGGGAGPHGHLNYQTMATANDASSATGSTRSRKRGGGDRGDAASAASLTTTTPAPPPRWKAFLAQFQSLELENKGSVARDHLALERTFLAWLRTSLAFASIGIAVTQLFRLNTSTGNSDNDNTHDYDRLRRLGRPLGTTFLAISVLVLFLGYHRYIQSQQWILRGKFPASRGTVLVVSLVAFALMVASLVVVVVVQPHD